MRYVLKSFSQTLPNSPVNVDVQAVSDDPAFAASIRCDPIEGLPGDFTNEDLLAAVEKQTGQIVELPEEPA